MFSCFPCINVVCTPNLCEGIEEIGRNGYFSVGIGVGGGWGERNHTRRRGDGNGALAHMRSLSLSLSLSLSVPGSAFFCPPVRSHVETASQHRRGEGAVPPSPPMISASPAMIYGPVMGFWSHDG